MTQPCSVEKRFRLNPVQSTTQQFLVVVLLIFLVAPSAMAARIGDLSDSSAWEQAVRFFTFRDPAVRMALIGCILLGICCGLLGTFIVVRQFALVGDTLAHAVLPGIAIGYLWSLKKAPLPLLFGAVTAGIIGAVVVSLIRQTTKTKRDAALGIVLGGFYGVGILLISMIQESYPRDVAGLKSFLFGSAAALNVADVWMIGIITILSVVILVLFYGQFKVVKL